MVGVVEDYVSGQVKAHSDALRSEFKAALEAVTKALPDQFSGLFKAYAERLQAIEQETDDLLEKLEATEKTMQGVVQSFSQRLQELEHKTKLLDEKMVIAEAVQAKIGRILDGHMPAPPKPVEAPPVQVAPKAAEATIAPQTLLPPRKKRGQSAKVDKSTCTSCNKPSPALAVKPNGQKLCSECNQKVARA